MVKKVAMTLVGLLFVGLVVLTAISAVRGPAEGPVATVTAGLLP